MRKGISPVVAVVLLIAIAVIAAVGVWYWVGEFTDQPDTNTDVKTFTLTRCGPGTNGTYVFVQNQGKNILDTNIAFYLTGNQTPVGYIGFEEVNVATDGGEMVPIVDLATAGTNVNISSGNYNVLSAGVQSQTFSC